MVYIDDQGNVRPGQRPAAGPAASASQHFRFNLKWNLNPLAALRRLRHLSSRRHPPVLLAAVAAAVLAVGMALWSILVPTANVLDRSDPLFVPTVAHATAPNAHVLHALEDSFFTQRYGRLKPVRTSHAPNWWDLLKARNRDSYVDIEDAGALLSARDARQHAVAREHLMFGEYLGDHLDENVGGFTRCAASAFAVITYFCGADAAHAVYDPLLSTLMAAVGAGALRRQLARLHALQSEHPQGLMPQVGLAQYNIVCGALGVGTHMLQHAGRGILAGRVPPGHHRL
jgi:hypothetical protein